MSITITQPTSETFYPIVDVTQYFVNGMRVSEDEYDYATDAYEQGVTCNRTIGGLVTTYYRNIFESEE